jgi:hypothetical protein
MQQNSWTTSGVTGTALAKELKRAMKLEEVQHKTDDGYTHITYMNTEDFCRTEQLQYQAASNPFQENTVGSHNSITVSGGTLGLLHALRTTIPSNLHSFFQVQQVKLFSMNCSKQYTGNSKQTRPTPTTSI